ncbi:hypothetical protein OIC43_38600 [Streptomyces sp. NBC_00825]|uniref:hypothetical protein n=1 Tax=unclassified Streptomyces TaxID=2593676 RepID=UPI002254B648|nr:MULTISPECIES: hypothetical protein [unclassified Streptomyces]WTB52573.1 hypothetical protein OG832_05085 [Streptomyces sp. NBC_00826]WTH94535.1 hypothetical protein OIC43_38600 [Streptomyces sp. NBC_00825]WTI03270.1 hypothetical protein OHA23_38580 [Streptomyces sp. NBC_00822]MCX4868818.1 hypothetical protein [Streptomyces sp. NBC_00906]MCX4900056.1 hypothetical protein [Streptomyces sp. NBC_00892]
MESVTSPWEPRERVEYVQELVGKGDSAVLSHALLFPKDCWDDGFGVTAVLRGLPLTDRMDLARSFAEYVITTRAGAGSQKRGLVLLAAVSHGFAESSWCDAWESLLRDKASRLWACGTEDDLWTCGHALLDAGRRLDGEVVALLRRSALEGSWPQECVEPVLSRIQGPVLNPGDGWADRVLAELPALGKPWHALVAHTLRAPTGRSSRTWDRRALALAEPLGPGRVRDTVTPWTELAAEGGGRDDGAYDAYNLPALVGLARLLSLLPPHPDSIRALGALVERPPLRSALTGTAVRALARFPHDLARSELLRLSTRVRHKVTHRQICEALAPERPMS